jgi:hypothetical protein
MVSVVVLSVLALLSLAFSFVTLPLIFTLAAAGYFGFRFFKIVEHSGCIVCWKKFFLATAILLPFIFSINFSFLPAQIFMGLALLFLLFGLTAFVKKNAALEISNFLIDDGGIAAFASFSL